MPGTPIKNDKSRGYRQGSIEQPLNPPLVKKPNEWSGGQTNDGQTAKTSNPGDTNRWLAFFSLLTMAHIALCRLTLLIFISLRCSIQNESDQQSENQSRNQHDKRHRPAAAIIIRWQKEKCDQTAEGNRNQIDGYARPRYGILCHQALNSPSFFSSNSSCVMMLFSRSSLRIFNSS